MNPEKKALYLKRKEKAIWLYGHTTTPMSLIAKNIGVSEPTVNHMVTGKNEPKWLEAHPKHYCDCQRLVLDGFEYCQACGTKQ